MFVDQPTWQAPFHRFSWAMVLLVLLIGCSGPRAGQQAGNRWQIKGHLDPRSRLASFPTVYAPYHDSMMVVAELFSTSITPSLAAADLDRIGAVDGDAPVPILITNEALASDFADRVQFVYVAHRPSEIALPQSDGSIKIGKRLTLDMAALSATGEDVTPRLQTPDSASWRSGPELLLMLPPEDPFDHVEITAAAEGLHEVDLRLRWKNTLLSTMLLYSMVLADMDLEATTWQEGVETDPLYAGVFSMIYERYSGIRVEAWNGSAWVEQARLADAGPIVWREESVTICTYGQDTVRMRLSGLADNIEIDAVEVGIPDETPTHEIPILWNVHKGTLLLQPPTGARHGTIFVRSQGSYDDRIHSTLVDPARSARVQPLKNGEEMIRELRLRWMDEHALLEEVFTQAERSGPPRDPR